MSDTGYQSRRSLWINKISDEVFRGVAEKIRSGELAAGAPLPPREELMVQFVTTDSVVERALEKLVDQGMAIRDADGVLRVAAPARDEGFAVPQSDEATLADVIAILELRIGIETEAAELAAERRSEEQLAAIQAAVSDYDAAEASEAAPADFRFHLSVSEAAGNRYFRDLTEYLGPLFIPRMRVAIGRNDTGRPDANIEASRKEHRAIAEAIARGDGRAAADAMRAHLTRTLGLMRAIEAGGADGGKN